MAQVRSAASSAIYALFVKVRGYARPVMVPEGPSVDFGDAMATWHEVEFAVQSLPSKRLNDTMWGLELPIDGTDRTQQVFLSHEIVKPDMAFVKVTSPLAPAQVLNVEAVVRSFGSLNVGSLSYVPFNEDSGMLCIGTSMPLDVLDLSQPQAFLLYLFVLARAADNIRAQIS
jgi:hypothetical protein